MDDAERFKVLLTEERDRKMKLVEALRSDITSVSLARQDSNVDDEHDPEGSTIAFELSQAEALLEQSRAGLEEINAALERIVEGSYGRCQVCGADIPEARLEARPWTPFCVEHASGRRR
ncbi:TraR/DksA C4-type zinc finger protein [Paenarthrobacter sp. CCNWLY172]|uniref:TraR/DksA family transcriptional regulator n=1 Tax=Paenarthrobacter sp. AMU7 TaxID=3162492 RepID=A0AB39YT08_9MICC|nr:TraR/DksA C4-type zinc finger protein [Paenarthrobacter sp. OM7]WGM22521.1 TraR/DksA C4-type zinc finger protein [Paenarthrobacter sp. OM7]